jgi:phosphatidylserine/phosphatidylglycerophosphate/cardiolipin synthase-like enzyme
MDAGHRGAGSPGRTLCGKPERTLVLALLLLCGAMAIFNVLRPMPAGLDAATPFRVARGAALLVDSTWIDAAGVQHHEQRIFDEMLRLIAQARRLIVLDLFLYNSFAGDADAGHRRLSSELTAALLGRVRAVEDLVVVLITDPINQVYGGLRSEQFAALEAAGVTVIETDLRPLRDSNPLWSGLWRLCCQWLGSDFDGGWLPNPLGPGKVPLRSLLAMANFKANHRKTLVVDAGDDWVGLVTSANPHDASSRHGNVALRFHGPAALDLLCTEDPVARFSGYGGVLACPAAVAPVPVVRPESGAPRIGTSESGTSGSGTSQAGSSQDPAVYGTLRVLTEAKIRDAALASIDAAGAGDRLDLAMFYLAYRRIIEALVAAHERGARVRVLLDPNEAAFGLKKDGVPNRPVAAELHAAGLAVRWANTRDEQFHSKLLLRTSSDGHVDLLAGSANFTRRNLDNLNLETSVQLRGPASVPALRDAQRYFDTHWRNEGDRIHSTAYETRADPSRVRYWRYRLMEATGLSTF